MAARAGHGGVRRRKDRSAETPGSGTRCPAAWRKRAPRPPRCVPRVWGPALRPPDRGLGPAARGLGPRSGVAPVSQRGSARPARRCRLVALSRAGGGRVECARRRGWSPEQGPRTASGSSGSGRTGGPGGGLEMSCLYRLQLTYLFLALLLLGEFRGGGVEEGAGNPGAGRNLSAEQSPSGQPPVSAPA